MVCALLEHHNSEAARLGSTRLPALGAQGLHCTRSDAFAGGTSRSGAVWTVSWSAAALATLLWLREHTCGPEAPSSRRARAGSTLPCCCTVTGTASGCPCLQEKGCGVLEAASSASSVWEQYLGLPGERRGNLVSRHSIHGVRLEAMGPCIGIRAGQGRPLRLLTARSPIHNLRLCLLETCSPGAHRLTEGVCAGPPWHRWTATPSPPPARTRWCTTSATFPPPPQCLRCCPFPWCSFWWLLLLANLGC